MFYIEKNDKPNWVEKKLSVLKVIDNTIAIPITEDIKESQIEKIAIRTNKKINKLSNSKKVVLSKDMKKEEGFVNYLNTYGLEICDGRWLFEILVPDIIEYVIEKKKIEKANISVLINDFTDIEIENIKILARKYKSVNIVTNHMEKFRKIEHDLEEKEGIIITFTNNKKRSLMKSQLVLNVDFPKELLNKYNIKDDAVIVNVKGKMKIAKKRFNGVNVQDYEIDFRDDRKDGKALSGNYFLRDLYEAGLYRKQQIGGIKEKMKLDRVVVKALILNNGEL